jgi:hypothetical protein
MTTTQRTRSGSRKGNGVATKRVVKRPTAVVDSRVQLQFRLSADTRDRIKAESIRRGVSVNYLIEQAITEKLSQWEKEKLPR